MLRHARCLAIFGAFSALDAAVATEERGLEVARKVREQDAGFGDFQASFQMILRDEGGKTAERAGRLKRLETKNDGNKMLVVFDLPKDIAGTAFLAFTHRAASDEQWLYLPSLRRVKRIAANNVSAPFMGSEFSYEDIASQELEKYRYKLLREEPCPGEAGLCFVNEQNPLNENSGYAKVVVWVHSTYFRPEKAEFFDRKGALLKTLAYSDYARYLDRYWRAGKMIMANVQTKRRTDLSWSDHRFKTGLTGRDFDQSALQRAR
jgi:outer membrane lipoprotein-sorting protein